MDEGQMIGHYQIVNLLGTGAMGTVHVAVDTFIDRPVAIKALRPELTRDPDFVSRFRAEAKSLAHLNHPNIASLYAPLREGDDLFMIMELVRGRPLDEILRDRNTPLGVKESIAITAQAADGLSYAHERGVIHRDIKPSNIMIANDGRIKIMDFGIARVRGSVRLTRTGTAIGTPLYMSPEQCRGGEGDERSDVYSLAIVLYEMLSGAPPFSGDTEYDLIQAQITKLPPPLIPKVPGVTPDLQNAIMKALSKKPEQRFPSMRAFSDALGATAMRADATSVVRNAAYLLEAPQIDPSSDTSQAGARSSAFGLPRSFATRHLAVGGAAVVALGMALVGVFYIVPTFSGGTRRPAPPRAEAAAMGKDAYAGGSDSAPQKAVAPDDAVKPEQKAVGADHRAGGDHQPQPQEDPPAADPQYPQPQSDPSAAEHPSPPPQPAPAALSPTADTKLDDLRIAVKGTKDTPIKASDFDHVNDAAKAVQLARTLADSGVAEAQFTLGMLLLDNKDHPDVNAAFNALSDAAKQQYPDAQGNLGMLYQNGLLPTGRDLDKAGYWFSVAAENKNAKAQFWLGCYYQFGWGGFAPDKHKAFDLYQSAAAGHYGSAQDAIEVLAGISTSASPCTQ